MYRSVAVFGTAAALSIAASGVAQATTFYLGGYGGLASSYSYEQDGIGLSVTAGSFVGDTITEDAYVGQYGNGLGVTNYYGDEHFVDGSYENDILLFEFDREVQLEAIAFTYNDGNDDFNFFWEVGSSLTELGEYAIPGYDWFSVIYAYGISGTTFGIGADHYSDEFKVYGIRVSDISQVPLPLSGLLLLGALGAVGLRRRQRV